MNAVTRTVRDALAAAPVSLREIGRRAGVSHAQLARIVAGQRPATAAVAQAVAATLATVGAECDKAAARVRRSLTTHHRRSQ
jgi:transcriptional regulator with XRE-family HTH domain